MLLNKEKTKEVIDKIIKGYPQSFIIKELNLEHNRNSILKSAKYHKLNYPLTRNTNIINGTYFDNIENDKQVYILGLIYADGCITKSGHSNERLCLCLNDKDVETVAWVLNELKPGALPYSITYKNQVAFSITLPYLTNKLKSLGIVYRKSFDTTFNLPNFIFNNDYLFFNFLKGVFDGDGSIFKTRSCKYQRYNLNFSSTNLTLIKKIKEKIELYLPNNFPKNITGNIRKDIWSAKRKTDLYQYTISNPLLIMWMGNKFYYEDTYSMTRKKERFKFYAYDLINTNTNLQNYYLIKLEAETLFNNIKI